MSLDVNTRLRTLRGEQFRHTQNLRRSRSHLTAALTAHTHLRPTLPVHLTSHDHPPPSQHTTNPDSPSWRVLALSIVLSTNSDQYLPSLTLLCLRVLASASDFAFAVVPYLPLHLRRALLRDAAVHAPLPSSKLFALCDTHGHVDGELIVVGPNATLRSGHFRKMHRDINDELSWDSPTQDQAATPELQTVVIMHCSVSTPTLLTLPPTITHLALIDIPTPLPLHRLPGICPLIVVLDLSHNKWASPASNEVQDVFCRVAWTRWNRLRVLGLREWLIPKEILGRVNKGRWNDVEVFL